MFSFLLTLLIAGASTVSIMAMSVDKERLAGERRMDALFAKKTEVLCPGYTQKGMSLCVRQYIKNAKVETASGYIALSHFISVAGNQDRNAKIYDEETAQVISMETLVVLQEQLKKENMMCGKMRPSGPQNLLAIKQVCEQEEAQFLRQQAKNKKYIQKHLGEMAVKMKEYKQPNVKNWFVSKKEELDVALTSKFAKTFFKEDDLKITVEDILIQHRLTIQVSCNKLEPQYKVRFTAQSPCEQVFSQIFRSCIDMKAPRSPASLKEKEIIEIVQKPLPCFFSKMQEYLTNNEKSAP